MRQYEVQCLDDCGTVIWAIPVLSREDGLMLVGHLNDLHDKLFYLTAIPYYNGKQIGGYTLSED